MDPITHGLLGATTSQAVYQSRHPTYRLWVFGLLAALAPDLDIFIRRTHDPLYAIYMHRHFTHALFFIPIGATIITAIALLLWPRYRAIALPLWITCFIGYATHGFLDCFTSWGTLWYWPFSEKRIAWDIISIVDPKVTIILLLGLVASIVFVSSNAARVSLFLLALLFTYAGFQHHRATQALLEFANKKHWDIEAYRVMPALASLANYSSVLRTSQEKIQVIYIKLSGIKQYKIYQGPEFDLFTKKDLPKAVLKNPLQLRDFTLFNWFSDGYVAAYNSNPLLLADIRFIRQYDPPYSALWGIEFPIDADSHVIWKRNIYKS